MEIVFPMNFWQHEAEVKDKTPEDNLIYTPKKKNSL